MNGNEFFEKINDLDTDLIEGANKMKKKNTVIKWKWVGAAAACACLIVGTIWGAGSLENRRVKPGETAGTTPAVDYEEPNGVGGFEGMLNVTAGIEVLGREYELSAEEAAAYLETVKDSISRDVTASGFPTGTLHFVGGFSTLRSGDPGNTMQVDWKQFFGYDGDRLAVTVDVTKDASGIHHFVAFGNDAALAQFDAVLKAHKGEELVMISAGWVEALVSPANEVIGRTGALLSEVTEEGADYYGYFKQPQNVFVP